MVTPTTQLGLTAGRARRHVGSAFCAARQPMPFGVQPAVASWRRVATAPGFFGCDATGLAQIANRGYGSTTGTTLAVKHTPNARTRPLGTRLT